jgi:hypothetical protein
LRQVRFSHGRNPHTSATTTWQRGPPAHSGLGVQALSSARPCCRRQFRTFPRERRYALGAADPVVSAPRALGVLLQVECRGGACLRGSPLRIVLRVSAVDDYFGGLDASQRAAFEHIRNLVMDMVPEAGRGTSYGMAVLKYKQKPLLAFRRCEASCQCLPVQFAGHRGSARPAHRVRAVEGDHSVHRGHAAS